MTDRELWDHAYVAAIGGLSAQEFESGYAPRELVRAAARIANEAVSEAHNHDPESIGSSS